MACCSPRAARRINPKSSNRRRMKIQWPNSGKAALGKMMASDDKKVKTNPAPKAGTPQENKSTSVEPSNAKGGDIAAASPTGYSRGEGQKPVSKAYKDNWNVIFAKKKSDNSRDGASVAFISVSLQRSFVGRPIVNYIQWRGRDLLSHLPGKPMCRRSAPRAAAKISMMIIRPP